MNFEPNKLFVGLIDFFAVLLPGAVITFFLAPSIGPTLIGSDRFDSLRGNAGAAAFAVTSYLLGHFVFLLGSILLDPFEKRITDAAIKKPCSRLARCLRLLTKFDDESHPLRAAEALRRDEIDRFAGQQVINAFQWAKAKLLIEAPGAIGEVHRLEADSKFFRSLVVVSFFVAVHSGVTQAWWALVSVALIGLLAFVRYIEQRAKSTRQAYWYLLTMSAARNRSAQSPVSDRGLTHAGGVVLRDSDGRCEVLLVEARKPDGPRLVLPKGHIEAKESAADAALREVVEETGWTASIGWHDSHRSGHDVTFDDARVRFFVMTAGERRAEPERGREPQWLTLALAITDDRLGDETKRLLDALEIAPRR